MSTTSAPSPASSSDPLRRGFGLLWPNLPMLLLGSVLVALGWSVVRALGRQLGWVSVAGTGLLVMPTFAALLHGWDVLLHHEHFGPRRLVGDFGRCWLRAIKITLVPTVGLLLTVAALSAWRLSNQPWMVASVAVSAAASLLAICVGVVALPYAVNTAEPSSSVWMVSSYIAVRNPVVVAAVLSAGALTVWAAAYLSFALIVLLPAPLAMIWSAAVLGATDKSRSRLPVTARGAID